MRRAALLVASLTLLGSGRMPALARDACAPDYGKPDRVVAACTEALSGNGLDDAKKAAALRVRAAAFKKKKDVEHALADLSESIRLDPTDAEAFYDRASLYRFERKDLDHALADISESIRLKPDSYPSFSFRGNVNLEREDLAGAVADFGEEIRLNPTGVIAYDSRGRALVLSGDYLRAVQDFDAGYKLDPAYPNVVASRNRAHAALAAGAALARAEGWAPGAAPAFQADPAKSLYSVARSWREGGTFHHCSFAFNDDKTALVVGRGRAGYVLVLASGQWSLKQGASYPVQVAIGDGPGRQVVATVMDPITIALPLGEDKTFIEKTKGYAVPITVKAGSNTIPTPKLDTIGYAETLEACWTKGTTPAAAGNPFAASGADDANPFAAAGPVATPPTTAVAKAEQPGAPAAAKPTSDKQKRAGAYFSALYLQAMMTACDVPTTPKLRSAFGAKLAALKPEMAQLETEAVKSASNAKDHCPSAAEMSDIEGLIRSFADSTPETFYDLLQAKTASAKTPTSGASAKP